MKDGGLDAVREVAVAALLHALDADVIAFNRVHVGSRSAEVPVVGPSWARSLTPPLEVVGPALALHPLVPAARTGG